MANKKIVFSGSSTGAKVAGLLAQIVTQRTLAEEALAGMQKGEPGGVRVQTGVDATTAGGVAEAVADLGAVKGDIYIRANTTYPVTSNLTIPDTARLVCEFEGVIRPASGVTVTVNAQVSAGHYKIFDTSLGGSFSFGEKRGALVPHHFGAVPGSITADDIDAQQESVDAWLAAVGELYAPQGTYICRTFEPTSTTTITGPGKFQPYEATDKFVLTASDSESIIIDGPTFDGNNVVNIIAEIGGSGHILRNFVMENATQPDEGEEFENTTAVGIQLKAGASDIKIHDFTIRNILGVGDGNDGDARGAARGITAFVTDDTHPRDIQIYNFTIDNVGPREDGDGIAFQGGTTPANIRIWNGTFTRCAKRALKLVTPGCRAWALTIHNDYYDAADPSTPEDGDTNMYAAVSIYASHVEVHDVELTGEGRFLSILDIAATTVDLENISVHHVTDKQQRAGYGCYNGLVHAYSDEYTIKGLKLNNLSLSGSERYGIWARGNIIDSAFNDNTLYGVQFQAINVEEINTIPGHYAENVEIRGNQLETLFASMPGARVSHGDNIKLLNNRPTRSGTTGNIVSYASGVTNVLDRDNVGNGYAVREFARTSRMGNRGGTVLFVDLETEKQVTFTTAEPDSNYRVHPTRSGKIGSPPAAASRASSFAQLTTGFKIELEAAPGVGNTISVTWSILR